MPSSIQILRSRLSREHRLSCLLLVLSLASYTSVTQATEKDVFNSGYLHDSTSDDFAREEFFFNYRNHRHAYFWPWEETTQTGLDWGVDAKHLQGSTTTQNFDAQRVLAMLGKRFSPNVYVEGWLGRHRLQVRSDNTTSLTVYSASAYLAPLPSLDLRLTTDRDFVYPENILPAGISQQLSARTQRVQITWRPQKRVRAIAGARWRHFNDDNNERYSSLNVLYGISPEWPWVWMGIGGERLKFDDVKPGYWTPAKSTAYGLRFEANFALTPRVNQIAQINVDRIHENDVSGKGSYGVLGLEIHLTRSLYLTLQGNRISSLQSGSRWRENTYTLFLSGGLR